MPKLNIFGNAGIGNTGESVEKGFYCDSDDEPGALVGRRVAVQWSGGRVYSGAVLAFHAHSGLHDVRYDDGEQRSYTLSNAYSARSVGWQLLPPI